MISVTCWSLYFSGDRLVSFFSVISVLLKVCPVPVSMSLQSLSSISCYGAKYQYDGAETSAAHCWHFADSDTMDRYALLFSSHFPEFKKKKKKKTREREGFPGSPVIMTSQFHCMPHSTAKTKQNNNKNKPFPRFFFFFFAFCFFNGLFMIVNCYFQSSFF